MPDQEPLVINSIRHPKCKCTTERICKRCAPSERNKKFNTPWSEAVRQDREKREETKT